MTARPIPRHPRASRPVLTAGCALIAITLSLIGCSRVTTGPAQAQQPDPPGSHLPDATSFDDYWYPHGAELSRYTLQQSRYGSIHPGHAVLIFVTEPLDTVDQVKSDDPDAPTAVPGLKLNATRDFNTGIYPYSMMTSVFQPIDLTAYPRPIKTTTSSQEWCGHTYTQYNLTAAGYRARQYSYFQSEGDTDTIIPDVAHDASDTPTISEDGLWTLIRIDPSAIPTGRNLPVIPSTIYTRLAHKPLQAYTATIAVDDIDRPLGMNGEPLARLTVEYPELGRKLMIHYHRDFPHVIESWKDTYPGIGGKTLATSAERTHSIMLDYWSKHDPEHRDLRRKLGLQPDSN